MFTIALFVLELAGSDHVVTAQKGGSEVRAPRLPVTAMASWENHHGAFEQSKNVFDVIGPGLSVGMLCTTCVHQSGTVMLFRFVPWVLV